MNPGSNRNIASRKLGSSFQNAHPTSAKTFRRRISAACPRVGALESGFTVEPWATIRSAVLFFEVMQITKRRTPNPPSQGYGAAGYLLAALAAATILSNRLSPRKESQHGLKRRSPYVGANPGIVAAISRCSSARARSPVHAYSKARFATSVGPCGDAL